MSWVIKASPRLAIFEPLRGKRILVVERGGNWLAVGHPDIDNDTETREGQWWRQMMGFNPGTYIAKTGLVPEPLIQQLIDDPDGGPSYTMFHDNAVDVRTLDEWTVEPQPERERTEEDEDDDDDDYREDSGPFSVNDRVGLNARGIADYGDQAEGTAGTILRIIEDRTLFIRWDNGHENYYYPRDIESAE
jgi:hypothetical protein